MARNSSGAKPGNLPAKAEILQALKVNPALKSKRDLTRYFAISGDLRAPFKALVREMEDEGLIARKGKSLSHARALPSVTVIDIPPDADPDDMIAYPANWDEKQGEPPVIRIETRRNERTVPAPGDRVLARIFSDEGSPPSYSARPMKVLAKPRRARIGIVRMDNDGARLIPVERKQKEMRIRPGDLGKAKDGDLVEVEVNARGRLMIPEAKVIASLGNPTSEGAMSMIALYNLEIPHRFPPAVLRAAKEAQQATMKGRKDWRDIPFVTIDPADAKDHDDAVHAQPDDDPKNSGGHIIHIAIADVAAYVTPGSPLDKEAYLRGNSVYFPDRVVPMLPERISNDLCSLKEGVDRPALALRLIINKDGQRLEHGFHRVMINCAASLSYKEAQNAFDGQPDEKTAPLVATILAPLFDAYRAMAKARDKRGPLDLDLPERKIIVDEDGSVKRIFVPERLEAMRLIEEMMVAANVCAAQTLDKQRMELIYRVHDQPGAEKLVALRDFLASLSLSFSKSQQINPGHFNQVLAKVKNSEKMHQVSEMVLRSQAQAEYSSENYGHFGLSLAQYAHFTSPIRRYADLIVHRALIFALKLGEDGLAASQTQKLGEIAQHISATERRAMAAERETVNRLIAHYLSSKVNAEFAGKISGITRSGLFVRLNETGADGFVPAASLGRDYFRHIEEQQAMIGEKTGERFRLGDDVVVRLIEAAPMAGALRFELLSEGERVTPPARSGTKGRKTTPGRRTKQKFTTRKRR
ncbi:3'-to-5' exoribonuclease RNase R [hydrothermal vent metagenome]|uniref:exoribonuclease II n=1 Tax=hydrothermal vent metagenome TaxID=652676 RepID=A0A3B0TKV2_9ZZZZ